MDSKNVNRLSALALIYLVFINVFFTEAQVTFSRDWNAGKRSNVPDCAAAIKSAAATCQVLLNALRAISTCEMHALASNRLFRQEDVETAQDVFGPEHNG